MTEFEYTGETDEEGRPHGKGFLSDAYGAVYEGEFCHGKRCGKGVEYDENGIACYVGEWKDDVRCGFGSEYINGQIIYEGEFAEDRANGHGKTFDAEGEILYEGLFVNDEPKEAL